MDERYEFAELSWGTVPNVADCTLSLFTYPDDHPNMGETYFEKPWMDVLTELGKDGWHIGAGMVYENIRVLLLQRATEPATAQPAAGGEDGQ